MSDRIIINIAAFLLTAYVLRVYYQYMVDMENYRKKKNRS